MKKGWKIFWIVTCCVAGLGLVLCGAALVLGLRFSDIEERYPHGIGLIRNEARKTYTNHDSYHYNNGDYSHSYSDITSLKLSVAGCNVYIEESDDNQFHVNADNLDFGNSGVEIQVGEDTGKLSVETVKNGSPWTQIGGTKYYGDIYMYLPENHRFDMAEFHFGAGDISIDRIHTDSLVMNIGASDCDVYDFQANEVTVNIGAGEIDMTGAFESDFSLKCGAGSADINLSGSKHEYNYSLKCGLGEIDLDNEEYGGLANARTIDNGASKNMDIICGVGEVSVEFGY